MRAIRFWLLGLSLNMMLGCAVIPKDITAQALPPIPFPKLIEDAGSHKGETAIVGGYVVSVENKADHSRIVAVQSPLGMGQKPRDKDLSQGRLVLTSRDFIDPEVYAKDRRITVAGIIQGSSATAHSPEYPYLELEVISLYLWPVERPVSDPYWYDYPWLYPYPYPWWRHPYHRHHWYH